MTDRYAQYEALRELALQANASGSWDLGAALLELARLVLLDREKAAVAALRQVTVRS